MKRVINKVLTTIVAFTIVTGFCYAAEGKLDKDVQSPVVVGTHLETIRKNATILMDGKLSDQHAKAKSAINTALGALRKEDKKTWDSIKANVVIVLNQKSPERKAAYDELMETIAATINGMTVQQINKVNQQAEILSEKQQRFEQALASMQAAVQAGEMTAEEAAKRAAAMSSDIAQDQQEVLESSSRLNRLGAALASPFQWIGNQLFDEQTSNLRRAVYTVGATAGVVALGAAAYYLAPESTRENFAKIMPWGEQNKESLLVKTLGSQELPEYIPSREEQEALRAAARQIGELPLVQQTLGSQELPEYIPSREEQEALHEMMKRNIQRAGQSVSASEMYTP